jgi:hypothetical protein
MTFQSVPIDMWINSDLTSKYWTNTHLAHLAPKSGSYELKCCTH